MCWGRPVRTTTARMSMRSPGQRSWRLGMRRNSTAWPYHHHRGPGIEPRSGAYKLHPAPTPSEPVGAVVPAPRRAADEQPGDLRAVLQPGDRRARLPAHVSGPTEHGLYRRRGGAEPADLVAGDPHRPALGTASECGDPDGERAAVR